MNFSKIEIKIFKAEFNNAETFTQGRSQA